MNQATEELARAWVDDLRGGKFKPTRFALHNAEGYCPLGVLSVRIAKDPRVADTGWQWDGRAWVKDGARDAGGIPWPVWKAAGLNGNVPSAGYIAHHAGAGETFETIANAIERAINGARVTDEPSGGGDA